MPSDTGSGKRKAAERHAMGFVERKGRTVRECITESDGGEESAMETEEAAAVAVAVSETGICLAVRRSVAGNIQVVHKKPRPGAVEREQYNANTNINRPTGRRGRIDSSIFKNSVTAGLHLKNTRHKTQACEDTHASTSRLHSDRGPGS